MVVASCAATSCTTRYHHNSWSVKCLYRPCCLIMTPTVIALSSTAHASNIMAGANGHGRGEGKKRLWDYPVWWRKRKRKPNRLLVLGGGGKRSRGRWGGGVVG